MINSSSNQYRSDIDGLRAIAIILVLIFHFFPNRFITGGFVGVDIFFVISGFLISQIIFNSLEKGNFTFSGFYARRIKRIFPALIIVLTACFIAGWFFLLPQRYVQLGKHITSASIFISNFIFWQEFGYFDISSEKKPLLHLWSLAIEEQFYLIWPLIFYFIWKKRLNFSWFIAAIILISFVANLITTKSNLVAAFYSPLTRFWELALGAFLWAQNSQKKEILNSNLKANWGIFLIIFAGSLFGTNSLFPGYLALFPTIGTYLVISAGSNSWLNRKILSQKILVWIGLISYPLYLWHWAILSFAKISSQDFISLKMRFVILLLSIFLAWMTYQFVEKPIRFGKNNKSKVPILCSLMLLIGLSGVALDKFKGFEFRFSDAALKFIPFFDDKLLLSKEWRQHRCFLEPEDDKRKFANECLQTDKRPLIFLWGDSTAAAFYPGLKAMQKQYEFGIAQFNASSCPPFISWENKARPFCKEINDANLVMIAKTKPDVILLHLNFDSFDVSNLKNTIDELRKIGIKNIILLGPEFQKTISNSVESERKNDLLNYVPPRRILLGQDIAAFDDSIRKMAQNYGIKYISLYRTLCNQEGCLIAVGENREDLTTFDGEHLTPNAAKYLVEQIFDDIFRLSNITN
jgi:peptidoglycan/LPS O-acetylase OafA/YrhL